MNLVFTVISEKFKLQVQDSDLEYFFWRFEKRISLSEKKPLLTAKNLIHHNQLHIIFQVDEHKQLRGDLKSTNTSNTSESNTSRYIVLKFNSLNKFEQNIMLRSKDHHSIKEYPI